MDDGCSLTMAWMTGDASSTDTIQTANRMRAMLRVLNQPRAFIGCTITTYLPRREGRIFVFCVYISKALRVVSWGCVTTAKLCWAGHRFATCSLCLEKSATLAEREGISWSSVQLINSPPCFNETLDPLSHLHPLPNQTVF